MAAKKDKDKEKSKEPKEKEKPTPAPAKKKASLGGALVSLMASPAYRQAIVSMVLIIGAMLGLRMAWDKYAINLERDPRYQVTSEQIEVTPQPVWIHADVKAEVIRDGSLADLKLTDAKLAERVGQAFAMHSWVAKVVRVEKQYPSRVKVELEYRSPIAAVEVAGEGTAGLLFVDASGVLLPSQDFAENQTRNFLRIDAGRTTPAGVYGMPWGDAKVTKAAAIAAAIGEKFRALSLYKIVATTTATGNEQYELQTRDGGRILWGHAPGNEPLGEATAAQKVIRLETEAVSRGALSLETLRQPLDLTRDAPPQPVSGGTSFSEGTRSDQAGSTATVNSEQ